MSPQALEIRVIKRLKLEHHKLLSSLALTFSLRRYKLEKEAFERAAR